MLPTRFLAVARTFRFLDRPQLRGEAKLVSALTARTGLDQGYI